MPRVPFTRRHGLDQAPPVDDDFPQPARIALTYLFEDLVNKEYVGSGASYYEQQWKPALDELFRTARFSSDEPTSATSPRAVFLEVLQSMDWKRVYVFCERAYDRVLTSPGYAADDAREDASVETASLAEVRQYYTDELNNILEEDNVVFHFVDGQFQRRGYAQTQRSFEQMGKVLVYPRLSRVRTHYNKARTFFEKFPEPDTENCIKEAICSLEACVEVVTHEPASKDFVKALRRLQNRTPVNIPAPIAEGIIKLDAYRGSGEGVAHAALDGSKVTAFEAELVLNLVASYVTYLVGLYPEEDESIPF